MFSKQCLQASHPIESHLDSDVTISMIDFVEVSIMALNHSQFNYRWCSYRFGFLILSKSWQSIFSNIVQMRVAEVNNFTS